MNPAMREHAASVDHVVKCTKVSQRLAIFIHLAKSLNYCHVLRLQFVTQCLQFVVKVLFCFVILVVCGCAALNYVELDVFFVCFEGGIDDPWSRCFPTKESNLCLV